MITEIKNKMVELRKARSPLVPSIAFAISQIEKIGKDNGNRDTTEDEAIKFVQKLVATLRETLAFKSDETVEAEIALYESLLPQMVSEDELRTFIIGLMPNNLGQIMKEVRAKYGSLVDMKQAKAIIEGL